MPLTDPQRIAREAGHPFLVDLWRALVPLRSVVSFMNTGAHPDDETSQMLAVLGFDRGIDLSCACSTRGEGGQNDIGREATQSLGVLRTAEMEQAAERLGLRMYWLSESPDDTIFDFGFSKSGVETLAKWGRERTLKRFVDILRLEKPDIICPTFLNIPGQHGHHRAMTEAAEEAMDLAADPEYRDSALPPWTVAKMLLPAWSGAGQAYDDDLPPPPETFTVPGKGFDPVTGIPYARLGEQSRAFHKTQAMGRWVPRGSEKDWPLHLRVNRVDQGERSLTAGLPDNLADLGDGTDLMKADSEIAAAIDAYPDAAAILEHASAALAALRRGAEKVNPGYTHKVARKEAHLAKLIRVAAHVECRARLERDILQPDDRTPLHAELHPGLADALSPSLVLKDGWSGDLTEMATQDAPVSDPYPSRYLPDEPDAPCLAVEIVTHGVASRTTIPFEVPPQVLPKTSADVTPMAAVINRAANHGPLRLKVTSVRPEGSAPALVFPDAWTAEETADGLEVAIPGETPEGHYRIGVTVDGEEARSVLAVSYPHVPPRHLVRPAEVSVCVVDAGHTDAKIGYIGAGNDRVDYWLDCLGLDVTALTADDLANEAVLARFDTIVIGIFAVRFRAGLKEAMPGLNRWVASGGTLVTLYHRPWDDWDPDVIPPARLEIGQPSLRWRVTDENAEVTHLVPGHQALTRPNRIGPDDWSGWHKERGLYFARSWDDLYQPLLEMADPDESPHRGALLAADIGRGRHIHCALILHHQMERLVPGAFRLMVNLVTPGA